MAGANPMTSGQYTYLFDKNFKKIFFNEYAMRTQEHMPLAKKETSDERYIKKGDYVSFGAFKDKPEGQPFAWDSFEQKNEKTVYHTTKALGAQIVRELFDDDEKGIMNQVIAELGKSAAYTKDLDWFEMLNNAFNTTIRAALDGKALCASDHDVYGTGGTQSNLVSGALSYSTLQAAIDLYEGWTNHQGMPVQMKPNLLIVGPKLKWKAKELTESEYNPTNANMGINTLRGEDLKYKVVHYLESDTAWFLASADHDLEFITRKELAFQSKDDFNTDAALYRGIMRYSTDFWNWQGIVGSSGA